MKKKQVNEFARKLAKVELLLNGGKGSGNFGHLGRPGKVGGSASKGEAHADLRDDLANYLDREKKNELIRKMRRMRTSKSFTPEHEQAMRDAGFSEDSIKAWKFKIGLKEIAYKDKQEHAKKLRERAKSSPEQTKAIDNIVSKIQVMSKDETWLRNNCSPEMAQAFSDEMNKAIEMGIGENKIILHLNDAEATNGSMGYRKMQDTFVLTISKKILRDTEATKATRMAKGNLGDKWWTSSEINGTFSHEIGHAMVWEALRKACGNNPKVMGYRGYTNVDEYMARLIVNQAKANVVKKGIRVDDLRMNKDRKYMSQYGRTNGHEAVAESFANPEYSELTKEIYKVARTGLTGKYKQAIDKTIENITRY